MYAYLRYSNIPAYGSTCTTANFISATAAVTGADAKCIATTGTLRVQVEFPIFLITLMNFCGWICFMVFLPLGQWALFFDNFFTFIHRPKPMKEDEFNRAKAELAKKIQALLMKGKKLVEDKKALPELKAGWFSKWRAKRTINTEQHLFETNCMLAEEEFQNLDRIASYNKKVDPCYYTGLLIFAIFALFLSLWFIIFEFMNIVLRVNGRTINSMFDGYLVALSQTPVSFIA